MEATIVRQAGRQNLRLVADHGRIIADLGGTVRTVAVPGATPVSARATPVPGATPVFARATPAHMHLTRRGRLTLTVAAIVLVAAVSMVLSLHG